MGQIIYASLHRGRQILYGIGIFRSHKFACPVVSVGNITAGEDGKAHLDQVFPFLTLTGPDSIVGRGFIVHAGKDDMTTQPTGNAGARAACGVIKAG